MTMGSDRQFYVKTTDEMYDRLPWCRMPVPTHESLPTSHNFDFEFGNTKIPYYKAPGMDNQAFFENSAGRSAALRFNVAANNKTATEHEIGVA